MDWNFGYLLFAIIAYIMIFGIRPFRGFHKTKAKTLDEFTKFVHEQNCQYVAVYVHEDLVVHTSDDGETKFYIVVATMNPFGFKFTYSEKTGEVSTHASMEYGDMVRSRNNRRAQQVHQKIKNSLAPTDKPILVTLQTQVA